MLFHQRRQSQDRAVRADLLREAAGQTLWMNGYSKRQFTEVDNAISVAEDFLTQAGTGEYCFVETEALRPWVDQIERIVIYRWNRIYPSDVRFDLPLETWTLCRRAEFPGYSHEAITKEVYYK